MKVFITVLMIGVGLVGMSQSHEAGTLLINVDYELGLSYSQSGSVDGEDFEDSDFDGTDVSSGLIRIDVQYGLADNIAAGVVARLGSFTTSYDDADLEDDKNNATEFGVELRYYAVNADLLNVFVAPSFGVSNTKADEIPSGADEADFKNSGIFWGVGAGANYFFSDNIGANVRVGYGARNYSDDVDFGTGSVEVKSGLGGVELGVGLTVKL